MLHNSRLFWAFENDNVVKNGAIPPEPLRLPGHRISQDSPFKNRHNHSNIHQVIKDGDYVVEPSDCSPYRLISSYGYVAHSPSDISFSFDKNNNVSITSKPWPYSESGFVVSEIAGSNYLKISTGIMIFFPEEFCLYQGPIPNYESNVRVMAGIEYMQSKRKCVIEGKIYSLSNLNIIIKAPKPASNIIEIKERTPLLWFYPVMRKSHLSLENINDSP